jgi:hypothetical protein
MEVDGSRHPLGVRGKLHVRGNRSADRATAAMFFHRLVNGPNAVTRRFRTSGEDKDLAVFKGAISLNQIVTKAIELWTAHDHHFNVHGRSPEQHRMYGADGSRAIRAGSVARKRLSRPGYSHWDATERAKVSRAIP